MKKRSLCVLFCITAISVLLVSGCTNQTPNNNNTSQTIHDEFSVNATGGDYELGDGLAFITVPQDAVGQQITITMDSVVDPPYDTNLTFLNCYTFGPEGTVFASPITLGLTYDSSRIPSGVPAENLSLYMLSGTIWSMIQNYVVDTSRNRVSGPVFHFSMVGVGLIPPEVLEKTKERNESQKNNSASITFEAPVQIYQFETNYTPWPTRPTEIDYSYHCGGYIAWDPSPYVRYYELNIHYNGNSIHTQNLVGSCDYRAWGANWCPLYPYVWDETTTKYIGGLPVPDEINFIGTFDNDKFAFGFDKHGTTVFNIYSDFDHSEGLSRAQIDAVEKEMLEFTERYVAGWTFTVKNVS
jgi:hypothetical protein